MSATLGNALGMHARSTSCLVALIKAFESKVYSWDVRYSKNRVCLNYEDGVSPLISALLHFASINVGDVICFEITGKDEDQACEAIKQLILDGFHEGLEIKPDIEVSIIDNI